MEIVLDTLISRQYSSPHFIGERQRPLRPTGIPGRKWLGQDLTQGLSRLSLKPRGVGWGVRERGGGNRTAQPLPPFSPWLSQAGLMPGALLPSLRLLGPLPETHQSPMDGWCRTPLSPEKTGPAQGQHCLPSSWASEGMEMPPIMDASSPRQPSTMPRD